MTWATGVKIRKGVQLLFFGLFIVLLFSAVEQRQAPRFADLFFRLNPLSALGAGLAMRAWVHGLEWALLTVAVTLLLGRVWCGWVCPMGTLLEWLPLRTEKHLNAGSRKASAGQKGLRKLKNLLLFLILATAIFGSLSLLIFDPIALFTRAMGVSVIPAVNYGLTAVETAAYKFPILRPVIDLVESTLRGGILPVMQPAFSQNLLIAALFAGILALNLLAPRFWCRSLCPLGALLGWLSKVAILRPIVGQSCNRCTRCAMVCRPGAVDIQGPKVEILPAECTVCLDCLADCKKQDIRFTIAFPGFRGNTSFTKGAGESPTPTNEPAGRTTPNPASLTRREALGILAAGAAGVLLLRTDLRARRKDPFLVRPPGAQDEAAFLAACLRCAQCMNICPTTALQPAAFEAGLEGLWTPMLIARVGYCDYGCHACGQACPSGAIPNLGLESKRAQVIAKASVNRDRCLPWASATPCIVCEEMCPTPEKSIRLEEITVADENGQPVTIQRPYVLRELCIGCGICENHCPLEGEAGIRIYGL